MYMVRNIFWGRYRLSLFIIPKDLDIIFDIYCICAFQVICWSMVSSWKLRSSTRLKVPHLILTSVHDWLYLVGWWLWNIIYPLFLICSDDLFNSSHFCKLLKKVVTPPFEARKSMWIKFLYFQWAEIDMKCSSDCWSPTKSDVTLARLSLHVGSSMSKTAT